MKLIIFSGGAGTRLWPLSRKSLPKQFIKMFNGKSTLQIAVDRVRKPFGVENIIISTNEQYVSMVKNELPEIPVSNIVGEPQKRDLAPAVGLNLIRLKKQRYKGPVALLWADHLIKKVDEFVSTLKEAEEYCKANPSKVVIFAESPRDANNNLGWIWMGDKVGDRAHKFLGWKYKPQVEECKKMFESGEWLWNSGYLVEDLDKALELYKKFQPTMYAGLEKIYEAIGTKDEAKVVSKIYPTLEKISHDNAISERLSRDDAVVFLANIGWSDPGTLYALKEALVDNQNDNLEVGFSKLAGCRDTLVYNMEADKLVSAVGLDGVVVVNTKDAILVVPKEKVLQLSELVANLEDDPKLKKFL